MPSYFRHIVHFLLVAMMLMSIPSCARWREAKVVIAEADRLLVNEKRITRDTAALNAAIKTLKGPVGYLFAKQELAKAYYFMGRNFYYLNDFSTASDYYILCDRLTPKDPIYRGRINSCMGYLCKQDSCFEEALEFYERANEAFYEGGDERRYAIGLLSIAEQHINLKEYARADSILQIADNYEIDSMYYAMLLETRGMYFFGLQQYDSALTYLLSIENYPRPIEAKCYSYQMIMQVYNLLNELGTAIEYARYIIKNSNNPNYRSNAYYHLINYAKFNDDLELISLCSCVREDEDRILRQSAELHAQATIKLRTYLDETNYTNIIILIIASLLGLLGIGIWFTYKRHCCILRKYAKDKQDRRNMLARRIYDHSVHFASNKIWQDYKKLRELANSHFDNMFYRLEDMCDLSEREIKICLMVVLEYSNKQMAEILFVQPNTISKAKNKIAKQLNTSSSELRTSLIDFLA